MLVSRDDQTFRSCRPQIAEKLAPREFPFVKLELGCSYSTPLAGELAHALPEHLVAK